MDGQRRRTRTRTRRAAAALLLLLAAAAALPAAHAQSAWLPETWPSEVAYRVLAHDIVAVEAAAAAGNDETAPPAVLLPFADGPRDRRDREAKDRFEALYQEAARLHGAPPPYSDDVATGLETIPPEHLPLWRRLAAKWPSYHVATRVHGRTASVRQP